MSSETEQSAPTRCYRHPDRETYIRCVRCGRGICTDCMRPASVGFQCPDEVKAAAAQTRQAQGPFGGPVVAGARPVVTTTLIAINAVMLVVTNGAHLVQGWVSLTFARLADIRGVLYVVQPDGTATRLGGVAHGEWYRLGTSMFLHFGLIHLAVNMFSLWIVGRPIEAILGRARYLAVYLVGGLGGSVGSFMLASSTQVGAGASGAIFGLFGSYFIVARRVGAPTTPILINVALNLALSIAIPHVDIRAHVGGLIVGTLVTAIVVYAPRQRRTLMQCAGIAGVLVVLAATTVWGVARTRSEEQHQPTPAVRIDAAASVGSPADGGRPAP